MNDPIQSHRLFDASVTFLGQLLDFRLERHALIASNIANADTPRYAAMDLEFEGALQKAIAREALPAPRRTHDTHLPGSIREQLSVAATPVRRKSHGVGNDVNSVDLDTEMTQLVQNNLLYNATAQLLSKKLNGLRLAIEAGR